MMDNRIQEIRTEKLRLIHEAIKSVTNCAKQSQKLSHDKHMEDRYSSALNELDIYRTGAEVLLTRTNILGK